MNSDMRHCHDRQRRRRRPRRHQVITIGMLHLAIAVAIHSPTASAFTPPLSTPMSFPTPSAVCGHRKDTLLLWAKKRQRESSSVGDDNDINYRETAKQSSNNENNIGDKTADEDITGATEGTPKQTLSGGSEVIFEMARRMLVWDDELYDSQNINDAGSRDEGVETLAEATPPTPPSSSTSSEQLKTLPSTSAIPPMPKAASTSLPRWRPAAIRQQSISNANPSFRTSSPVMTNAGYAGILRRNSRKNNPSMWRHCLRIYGTMAELEKESAVGTAISSTAKGGQVPGVGTHLATLSENPSPIRAKRKKKVKRSTAHHEAALVAASKLGMWEEALRIYRGVEESALSNRGKVVGRGGRDRVTDNMVLSVISACVKGSKVKRTTASSSTTISSAPVVVESDDTNDDDSDDTNDDAANVINATDPGNATESNSNMIDTSMTYASPSPSRSMMRPLTIEERRKPLDLARDILLSMEEKHDIPLVSRHVNQLASAYVRLGLRSQAAALINDHLKDRIVEPPPPTQHQPRPSFPKKRKEWKEKREEVIAENWFEGVKLLEGDDDLFDQLEDENDEDYDEYIVDGGYEETQLNIHQVKAKDRASYSLLVQGAAMEGDWTSAVQELQRMTDAGLHPNSRNLNSWSEVMEKGCRPSGNGDKSGSNYGGIQRRRSWKKKRDGIWLENLR
mmetsp:Transcript_30636/g.56649  ORF Transcript_30636/g.56649 Transcript_30636/m.56649 type:complete len:679 (-) Transcript_30636:225-2261(-)